MRRKTYHHGDLEHALVAEALRQVRERGADAVSLRQVAQTVGVSPSAAYAHFPDKLALMLAVASAGMALLDERLTASGTDIDLEDGDLEDGDLACVLRFLATGEAYVGFAVDEPHLFRHVFGPICAHLPHKDPEHLLADSTACRVVRERLDALADRGLLRPGVRTGLDLASWTLVHGFSSLVLDGLLPIEVGTALVDTMIRLALSDEAAALAAQAGVLSPGAPVAAAR